MALQHGRHIPTSTYRTQMNAQFTFSDLEKLVPYLHSLGMGDSYSSPILFSPPGSTHGYDVSDYRRINPELGGEEAFRKTAEALQRQQMGLLVDFVPNHMGINGPFNRWWADVLERGRTSPFAHFFDVYWREKEGGARPRILVPVLEDHYGVVLENGGLSLDYGEKRLRVRYGESHYPLSPESYAAVFEGIIADPECPWHLASAFRDLSAGFREAGIAPATAVGSEEAEKATKRLDELKDRLASLIEGDAVVRKLFEARLARLNGKKDQPRSFDELDRIMALQHFRLARWKTGMYAANYRRFFAVDTLIGLRMENPEVFTETHALLSLLLHERLITGLRIDHIDGLWDPQQYLERLQSIEEPKGEAETTYVVVEKILENGEGLPESWPAHGTTGYEFILQCARLFTRSGSERELTELYHGFTGLTASFEDVVYEKKKLVLQEMFANTVATIAVNLSEILMDDRRRRDLTRPELVVAIREIMAGFPVYRTYRRLRSTPSEEGARSVQTAYENAVRRKPLFDPQTFALIRDIILGVYPPAEMPEEYQVRLARWALSFQQYSGAIMAKAVEDTAFYLYNRLVALNEVGGNPGEFGGTVAAFHEENARRREKMPHSLVATSTHDTKMSEDVRARLYVLSEIPAEWKAWLEEWREINRGSKSVVDGQAVPDANEEYRLYQILLGAWPLDEAQVDDAFRERMRQYVRKSVSEAKLNTTWVQPNEGWLQAGDHFIDAILTPGSGRAFLDSFRPKAARLAHLGLTNSLTQLILKLTSPGVPDFYQGNEIWDFSLVDPDNRRPVDYERRQRLLAEAAARPMPELLQKWPDGGIKLRVTQTLAVFRREHPDLFAFGDYAAFECGGDRADRVVAFRRSREGRAAIVVVPRLTADVGCPPVGEIWGDTVVKMGAGPENFAPGSVRDLFTGETFELRGDVPLSRLFATLPFAVLATE